MIALRIIATLFMVWTLLCGFIQAKWYYKQRPNWAQAVIMAWIFTFVASWFITLLVSLLFLIWTV